MLPLLLDAVAAAAGSSLLGRGNSVGNGPVGRRNSAIACSPKFVGGNRNHRLLLVLWGEQFKLNRRYFPLKALLVKKVVGFLFSTVPYCSEFRELFRVLLEGLPGHVNGPSDHDGILAANLEAN